MGRSTAPTAEAALCARLAARVGFENALVQVGLPAKEPAQKDRVYFASIDDLARRPEAHMSVRGETYTLSVLVEVRRPGKTREVVTARMWEIIDEIEAELWRDQELSDDVESAEVAAIPTAFTVPHTDGWIGKANVQIRVDGLVDLRG